MTDAYPDIEIYAKRPEPDDVRRWLQDRFGIEDEMIRGDAVVFTLGAEHIECDFIERAVKGGYASLWFRSGKTPWARDIDCAKEAFEQLGVEIRCSAAPWQDSDGEDDEGGWIRLTDKGEARVNWRA